MIRTLAQGRTQHAPKARNRARGLAAGFTLLETLIATIILSGGILVLANSWSGNVMRIRNARVNNTMAALLERKMTEVEIKYRTKPVNEIEEEAGGDFGAKYPGYRWTMKSQPFEMPDMSSALISREGGADEMLLTMVRTTSEFIKEVAKEVSVSVYYKGKRGNEIRHTVTTYFIDYTKEFQIPGMPAGGMGGLGGGAPGGGAPGGGAPGGGG